MPFLAENKMDAMFFLFQKLHFIALLGFDAKKAFRKSHNNLSIKIAIRDILYQTISKFKYCAITGIVRIVDHVVLSLINVIIHRMHIVFISRLSNCVSLTLKVWDTQLCQNEMRFRTSIVVSNYRKMTSHARKSNIGNI